MADAFHTGHPDDDIPDRLVEWIHLDGGVIVQTHWMHFLCCTIPQGQSVGVVKYISFKGVAYIFHSGGA